MKKLDKEQLNLKKVKEVKVVKEFREFISRGNVIDMAVGIIVGTAFTAIVNSMVKDILTPVIGFLMGGVNFEDLKWVITPATETAAEVSLNYGMFIQKIVEFLIISLSVFILVKVLNMLRRKRTKQEEEKKEAPKPSDEVLLLTEIRDLLKRENAPAADASAAAESDEYAKENAQPAE